jgi:hypothetical protein
MPRHPPCALTHLTTTRCSHPLCNTQHTTTPDPTTATTPTPPHTGTPGRVRRPGPKRHQEHTEPTGRCLLRTQQRAEPSNVPNQHDRVPPSHTPTHPPPTGGRRALITGMESDERRTPTPGPPATRRRTHTHRGRPHHTAGLLRKEVIQPHLPVRLPCYDFVPIASPTFDNSLPTRG